MVDRSVILIRKHKIVDVNTEAVLCASEEVDVEINTGKTKCMFSQNLIGS
jgi:hypothetical protein